MTCPDDNLSTQGGRSTWQHTGIFSRKSSWLKRWPRSVLEDGLGVELNRPEGRSTSIRCRFPGNEVWRETKKSIVQSVSKSQTTLILRLLHRRSTIKVQREDGLAICLHPAVKAVCEKWLKIGVGGSLTWLARGLVIIERQVLCPL